MSLGKQTPSQGIESIQSTPRNSRRAISIVSVVAAVIAGIAGKALGGEVYDHFLRPNPPQMSLNLDATLARVVSLKKPTLPKKLDDVTTMTDISFANRHMTYVYDLAIGGKQPQQAMAKLRKVVAGRACGSDMRQALQSGYTFTFRYDYPGGGEIGEFSLTGADCG